MPSIEDAEFRETPLAPSALNTVGAVVLFHPEGDLVTRMRRVLDQVDHLVLVSNDGATGERLSALNSARITHLCNSHNPGLAYAINQALGVAIKSGYCWCLLLDQDTEVDTNLVESLSSVYLDYPHPHKIGLLAPNYRSPGGSRIAYATSVPWQSMDTVITSGSLVPMGVARKLGGMREEFFIECIDLEFSLRVRAAGLQVVASGRPLMTHGAGAAREHELFGRTVLVGDHPPARCFLQFRNLSWILWHYGSREPRWTLLTLAAIVKRLCIVLLFEKQRFRKLWAMLHGTLSGSVKAFRTDRNGPPQLRLLE